MSGAEAYPLEWPEGYPRTRNPERSRFNTTFTVARDGLVEELQRMRASHVVISTNVPIKGNGLPYANRKQPDDPGVAVYFYWRKAQHVLACDRWRTVAENLQALRKSVEAMRGLERWGASGILERAFSGFQRLNAPQQEPWWEILGVSQNADWSTVLSAYKHRRSEAHPDRGGTTEEYHRIEKAFGRANIERGMV